ncbi:MAG: 3'-5' exonuclease [Candidatus Omnitrophota bacterium]
MKIMNMEYVVFDVETTGLSPVDGDRIIELAAARVRRGVVVDRYTTFVNPRRPLNPEAEKLNHISQDMVKDAPTSDEILPRFIEFAGSSCLVAHNASFDIKFVSFELALAGRKLQETIPVLDTIKMSRSFLPHLTSQRLEYIAHSLGVAVGTTHRAMADVEILVSVMVRLFGLAPDYNVLTFQDLVSRFGVEKPSFRVRGATQPSLF